VSLPSHVTRHQFRGALLLDYYDNGILPYAGKVGTPTTRLLPPCSHSRNEHAPSARTGRLVSGLGHALPSDGHAAESAYREAIKRLERSRVAVHLARAHLLYGEWLRREHRQVDVRAHLRVAHEMLSRFGVEAFAERDRRELLAAGETTPKCTSVTQEALTAQEGQIARFASRGTRTQRSEVNSSSAHDRRVRFDQGLHEAAHQLSSGAQEGPAETRSHGCAELAEMTRLSCSDRQIACRADGLGMQLGV
jgi:hypothetical protein